ncbi:pentatricopeptide repeat-containing protein At1g10910, chloroplastic isoform X2 [Cornus florida]|uniref:pentatricopeptide repeat-containing protein At1g10910, chloroplastic isoform X2 n=1 Tax=Cornus florida TaxID=4283 RepID=UPI00289C467E|nr:pentatricopeptide repeat-containing protein At1g10910, chloroplastic isoform X2 [Cornus florida]
MEICHMFGNGFQPILARPSLITSSLPPSPAVARPTKSSQSTSATINVSATSQRPLSVSHTKRQSAIRDIQQSSELDSALARSGGMLKVQDLNVVLRHFGNLSRWQELSQLFDWMLKQGKISISSYSSYIKFMGKSRNPVKALEVYNSITDESIRNNVTVCNSILSCLVRNGKFDSSIRFFHQMKQNGLRPDIVTYSTLLSGCTKAKHGYSKALELVEELKYNGVPMDSIVYGTLLAVCASNNQCKEAEQYFNQMKDEGHSPNVFHYSSLLNAYSVDGNYTKADELVQDMKCAGLVPNKVILTTLLKVYVRGGLFEKSRELLTELEALGYAEDEMPYCLLLDGLAKAGHIHEAKSVFDDMKNKHVKSDGYSDSIMISAFCRSGLLEDAKQLACNFEATYDKYDVVILNTMLCAYCRAGEMESVMKMMRKMDELEISPDWNTFHILIKYFFKEKLYLLAYRTMEDMHRKGHQPEEELCSFLIDHLGKIGAHPEAFSVYNMLRYNKRTMCKDLHGKILHILIGGQLLKDAYVVVKDNAGLIPQPAIKKFATAFMKAGNINLINDVIKALHSSGSKIGQGLFHMAISRYIEQPEKKELLLQLLQWMPGQGYVVDSSTRNLILKNSHLFGRQVVAEILSKQHMVSKTLRPREMKNR